MKCPRCQRENPPHLKFCLECATPLALLCWNCETQLPAGAMCFEYTSVRGPGRRPPPRFASLETYPPKAPRPQDPHTQGRPRG
jgi:hypothetical protein